jgi:hypothetical protein
MKNYVCCSKSAERIKAADEKLCLPLKIVSATLIHREDCVCRGKIVSAALICREE